MTTKSSPPPEIAYGVKAIAKVVNDPNERRVVYRLEKNYYSGAWKAGRGWALTVPVFLKSIGLDPDNAT